MSSFTCHLSPVSYHLSPVTHHLSPMQKPRATDLPLGSSPTMHSRVVLRDPKIIFLLAGGGDG